MPASGGAAPSPSARGVRLNTEAPRRRSAASNSYGIRREERRITRTSRARQPNIIEPIPRQRDPYPEKLPAQEPPAQEPPAEEPLAQEPPAEVGEAAQPDSSADQADLDARLTGMSLLLRMALRLMQSYETGDR
jgi:hypothetical protein